MPETGRHSFADFIKLDTYKEANSVGGARAWQEWKYLFASRQSSIKIGSRYAGRSSELTDEADSSKKWLYKMFRQIEQLSSSCEKSARCDRNSPQHENACS